MQGRPPHCSGSTVMRSINSATATSSLQVATRPQDGSLRRTGPIARRALDLADLRLQKPDAVRCDNHRLSDCWLSPDARPVSKLPTLMSSSKAGQWMPEPPPISRQFERSSGVPCRRRGYHASGAEIERPSDSSAVIASPLMVTVSARTTGVSVVEELIPAP
jgi:hypothetical protein